MSGVRADPHLVLAWGTIRPASFADRVAAAAVAGFGSIGLALPDYLALRTAGWTDDDLRRVLDQHQVTIDEVEVLFGFNAPPGPAGLPERPGLIYSDPGIEAAAFHLADAFGVRHVQAVGTLDQREVGEETAAAFGALCDRADQHDLRVALEFVPYSCIGDLSTAVSVVEAAARENGGLCIDTWHFFRGTPDLAELAAVPGHRVFMVQVNDGPSVPVDSNRMTDAVHNRRLPGAGDFDLESFVAALDRPDVAASVSVEVYSDELHQESSAVAASLAMSATRSMLAL